MFDIGASEILVIGVVALIVIGPERLPRVAKTLGHLFGRMQRYVNEVKADINREIELEELRKFKSSMEDAARGIQQSVSTQVNYIESEVKQAGSDIQQQVESAVAPAAGIQLIPPATPAPDATAADAPAGEAAAEAPAATSDKAPAGTGDKSGAA
ncbi:MAG TPA: Sec-independent protein translocase protein TatB [Burkholderiales bacterium]|nr:Sec-independent protein translocase protein TatB [Burkholderiales bacterium]